jgi:hypothetical protein
LAGVTEQFPASRLKQIQVAGMINVVADRAVSVSDAVFVTKQGRWHGQIVFRCRCGSSPDLIPLRNGLGANHNFLSHRGTVISREGMMTL